MKTELVDALVKLVCDRMEKSIEDVKSKNRNRKLCETRQVVSYVLLENTDLKLLEVAEILNYVSHASPFRDRRQVSNFLEIDKLFAARVNPIIADAVIMTELYSPTKKPGKVLEDGDICWFWNDNTTELAVIGSFEQQYVNEDLCVRYMNREYPGVVYSHCEYAGEGVLPLKYRLARTAVKECEEITV